MKICTKCQLEKELADFYKLQAECIVCFKIRSKKSRPISYQKNREKELRQAKAYRKSHEKYYREYGKSYRRTHREEIRADKRRRYKEDINFKIAHNVRVQINQAVKGQIKGDHSVGLLGCTIDELKLHLNSKFTNGMSWNNYGAWHIDHIKPCASFDLSKLEEQRKCFNYTNLQPLWAIDNFKKGSKIE